MWKKYLLQTGSRVILLSGQFILLVACVVYVAYIYIANILPDVESRNYFNQAECFLISKKLNTRGHFSHAYRSDFLISYNVNGVQYSRWVYGNGLDYAFTREAGEQEDVLAQFEVGGTYTCWYNPDNPKIVLLVKRHNWASAYPLILPASVGLIALYYFLKNFFNIVNIKPTRGQRQRRKRGVQKEAVKKE